MKTARSRRLLALTSAVLAFASCTVNAPDLTGKQCPCVADYVCDTATNTCVAPGALDGAPPSSDGTAPDDAMTTDSSIATDASVDGEAGPTRYCDTLSPKPTFCADFDEPDAMAPWGFTTFGNGGNGQLGVDTVMSHDKASAYFEVGSAADGTNQGSSHLNRTLSAITTTSNFTIDLDLLVEKVDEEVPVISFDFTQGNIRYTLYLGIQHSSARILEQISMGNAPDASFAGKNLSNPFPIESGWVHVKWTLVNSTTATVSTTTVTGADGGVVSNALAGVNTYKYTAVPTFEIGIPYTLFFPTSGSRFRVDNVVVNQQ